MRQYHIRFGGRPTEKGRPDRHLAGGLPYMSPEHFAAWLDPKQRDHAKLLPLLRPCPAQMMQCWPVGPQVNSSKVEEAGLTDRVELPARTRQPTLAAGSSTPH